MPSEEANLSAFAAYSQASSTSSKSPKKKRKSGPKHDYGIDDFLTAQLRQYVEKPKKKSNAKHNSSKSVSKENANSTNESPAREKKQAKSKSEKRTKRRSLPDGGALNFTKDFESSPDNLQGTSTPSVPNGVPHSKRSKKNQPSETEESPVHVAKKLRESAKNGPETPTRAATSKAHASLASLRIDGSIAMARHHFQWILNPVRIEDFKEKYWEKAPVCINRSIPKYYSQLISTNTIDEILRENIIEYTKNIDITSYENGVRETHNPEGRALPPGVWSFYRDGCSIRLLNPQTFIPQIHELNATLQEYFHCMVGANVYLTPPNSQGFAPHYDDIEAFVLQIEGKKQWRLYAPRTEAEYLPRVSSGNFSPDEIGDPILERVLEPGDLLYFPRGTIHQANTVPGHHSLHITLSVYQKTAYADLLEILLPRALEQAISSSVEMRRGVPLDIWNHFGLVNQDEDTRQRNQITAKVKKLCSKIIEHLDIDAAVDQMATKFQHDALPPVILPDEAPQTVYGSKCRLTKDGRIKDFEFQPDTRIRLLRANILRMIEHEDAYRVYFYTDNSKEYHEYEPNFVEIECDMAPAVEFLIKAYPKYVTVDDLPVDEPLNIDVTHELWNRGLIMLENPSN